MYLVRYHGEATARITGHGGLDRGVQCEDVGLVGNVVNQANDVTDLLGRFTEAFDPLRGVLDLLTDVIHAGDGVVYDFVALVGDGYGTFRYRGGLRAFADTWSIDTAISLIAAEAPAISCAWCSEASARCIAVAWVSCAAPAT